MTHASEERAMVPAQGADRATPLFLITRDDPADEGLAREAAASGYRVQRVALLATEPGAQAARLIDSFFSSQTAGTAYAWTSRRAAKALVRALTPQSRLALGRARLYALGAESAAPAREAGLHVRTPNEAPGASQLAAYIAGHAGSDHVRRIVFLHGNHALPDFPDGLRARGIEVYPLEVYRTRFLSPDTSALKSALQHDATIAAAFYSPSGIEALERLLTGMELTRLRGAAVALARGATTYEALRSLGYRNASYPKGSIFFHPFALEALRAAVRDRT